MGRSPCCAKEGLNRGAWTATEDKILTDYIKIHGEGKWRNLPKRADFQPIRTKASKCTRVIITTQEPQKRQEYLDSKQAMVEPGDPVLSNGSLDDVNVIKGHDSFPEFDLGRENHYSSDFMIDFEMDENFLSEFLNGGDFSELAANFDTNNGGGGGDHHSTSTSTTSNNNCERGYSSANSDNDHQDDKLHDSDFSFMESLMGSGFEWFQD
ncbi:hypothetical protein JRO89_XS09G0228200 [Xanthoceras sorbifolium]|uniref:Uncharacterized protein n=1 Tax=Xanthoceras sorbifolium TaxID=99658 RepID=A0ABQ8HMJ7_9ROSI|nr:hypothetical protein JRO89_XS09G0228200 [Xanthoceras sorbifolium]